MKSIAPIIALAFLASFYLDEVSPQIILEVPGYGVPGEKVLRMYLSNNIILK